MRPAIFLSVVDHDLCIGCGLCAAMCPDNTLKMQFNKFGEYNPVSNGECTKECGICLKVCPFADSGENEDTIGKRLYGEIPGIRHLPETGYYLASYVGYSEKHRPTSASGGIVTWLLEALLIEGIVNHVICVAPTKVPDRLFSFQVFDTPEEVRTGAGSAYYPVELSGVIRHVIDNPGRYVITGLPCFIKAIRLAQQRNKKLKERIVITLGLVCGQMKSTHFTDYIATLAGVQGEVTAVRYRGKSPDQPASNYHYKFTTTGGEERKIHWNEGISEVWTNRWFTPNACNYCDDVFAECADVTCMDAWLPEYSNDPQGVNLLIVRSIEIFNLINNKRLKNERQLEIINNSRIIRSQRGVISYKRDDLAYRLYHDNIHKAFSPKKRIQAKKIDNPLQRMRIVNITAMQKESRQFFQINSIKNFQNLQNRMRRYLMKIKIIRTINFPYRAIRYSIELISRRIFIRKI